MVPSQPQSPPDRIDLDQDGRIRRELIKDSQWGTIPLLKWEDDLLLHPIFARLHNILQNSTAFRVYPSLRTSRYVHSVGVMHVACEMFRASVIESQPKYVLPGGLESTTELASIRTLGDEGEILIGKAGSRSCEILLPHVRAIFPVRYADGSTATDGIHVALAALRMAALLHDIGHLPGSHIFEFAVAEVATTKEDLEAFLDTINDETERKIIREFVAFSADFGAKFHEEVGRLIMELLASEFEQRPIDEDKAVGGLLRAAIHILHGTSLKDAALCCFSFVSSFLDADRIDFVRRDCETSGLLRSSVDYGRLLRFMELRPVNVESRTDRQKPQLVVMPSSRARSDTEKVLTERFQDYLYIAAHHRVHLGDELLARCIRILLRKGKLKPVLETLLRLKNPDSGGETARYEKKSHDLQNQLDLCTKFDDAWLEYQVRQVWLDGAAPGDISDRERYTLAAHVLSGSTLGSAFRQSDDFVAFRERSAANKQCTGWFDELQQFFASGQVPQAFHLLSRIALAIKDAKLKWEGELFNEFGNKLIIVGDLSRKLKTGCPPTSRLIADSMEDLIPAAEFLSAKLRRVLVLNIWFDRSLRSRKDDIISWVCRALSSCLQGTKNAPPEKPDDVASAAPSIKAN